MGIMDLFRKKPARTPAKIGLEDQLATFAASGIKLRPGHTINDLLNSYSRENFESEPYRLLAVVLGDDLEGPPYGRHFSDELWHLDTECIEGDGSYIRIANRIQNLCKGALPMQNVTDLVDTEADSGWLEFTLSNKTIHIDVKLQEDWLDPQLFSHFARLLRERAAPGNLISLDLQGQDMLLGYATPAQMKSLRESTGLNWVWISQ